MLFIVDGYNVTRRDSATSALSLEQQREALVARLRVRGRELLGNGRIVVVFDGEGGPGLSTGGGVPVEIVYAHKHSADDEIVRIASRAKGAVVVVSSDRDLGRRASERATASVEVREASTCLRVGDVLGIFVFDLARIAGNGRNQQRGDHLASHDKRMSVTPRVFRHHGPLIGCGALEFPAELLNRVGSGGWTVHQRDDGGVAPVIEHCLQAGLQRTELSQFRMRIYHQECRRRIHQPH